MEPDTLILNVYGTDYPFEIVTGAVLRVGSDPDSDICLQGEGIAPDHCTIETLAGGSFRLRANDSASGFSVNGVTSTDMTVKTPFSLGVSGHQLGVRLVSQTKHTITLPPKLPPAPSTTRTARVGTGTAVPSLMEKEPFPAPQEKPFSFARAAALFCILAGGILVCAALMVMSSSGDNAALSQPVTVTVQPTPVAPAPTDKASPSEQAKAIVAAATAQKEEQPAPALPQKPEAPQIKNIGEDFTLGSFQYRITSALKTSVIGASDFESQFIDELGKAPEMQIARLFGIDPIKAATGEGTRNANSSYYVIRYEITNLGKTVDAVSNTDFQVIDSQDRQFTPTTDATMKLIERQDEDFLLSELQPGITRACAQAFELPEDAFAGPLHLLIPEKGFFKTKAIKVVLSDPVSNKKDDSPEFKNLTFSELSSRKSGDAVVLKLGGGSRLKFRFCEAGAFTTRNPNTVTNDRPSEKDTEVVLSSAFWITETECTQRQWSALMDNDPSERIGPALPVDSVSWVEAEAFIKKLNSLKELPPNWEINWAFALPTEAQWEYACRSGENASINEENNHLPDSIPYWESMAWFKSNSRGLTSNVANLAPNDWGLFDMHGNVAEWCSDWYSATGVRGNNPVGPSDGIERVVRGGSYSSNVWEIHTTARSKLNPSNRSPNIGFRVAIVSRHNLNPQAVVSNAVNLKKKGTSPCACLLGHSVHRI
jgi:hypothetical protein